MQATYKNPWHNPSNRHAGPEVYTTDAHPTKYRGFLIYHRINSTVKGGDVFDIVKDSVCVSQYAGMAGAKNHIDILIKEVMTFA